MPTYDSEIYWSDVNDVYGDLIDKSQCGDGLKN